MSVPPSIKVWSELGHGSSVPCFCGMSSKLMIIRQFFELRQRYQLPLFKECIIYRPNEIHIVFRKRGESRYGIYTWSSRNNSCTFLHRTVVRLILRMGTVRMGWCIKFSIKKISLVSSIWAMTRQEIMGALKERLVHAQFIWSKCYLLKMNTQF